MIGCKLKICPFCQELQKQKELEGELKENNYRNTDHLRTEYKIALVVEYYDFPNDPNWCTGRLTGVNQQLNFCPVCGKNIKEVK